LRTAIERKQKSEDILSTLGLPVPDSIPEIEEEDAVALQTSQEVAERIVILAYVNCAAIQPGMRNQMIDFLKEEGFWKKASTQEREWFEKEELTEQDMTDMLWRGEAIWLLLWVINKVDKLYLPTSEVNVDEIFEHIPPFMQSAKDFISTAATRSKSEILDECDLIFRLVWIIKEWNSTTINELTLNEGVAFERHFTIDWVMGRNRDWDR
jgi:hypothetical protein